jgi:hypothetical protein
VHWRVEVVVQYLCIHNHVTGKFQTFSVQKDQNRLIELANALGIDVNFGIDAVVDGIVRRMQCHILDAWIDFLDINELPADGLYVATCLLNRRYRGR